MNRLILSVTAGLCCLAAAAAPGKTHALLIGIGTYPDRTWSLNGPTNDTALMRAYLESILPEATLHELRDAEATHTAVVAALEALQHTAPDDQVVIFYSGHGSHTPDLNGDEDSDDQDETWVTYGARTGAPGIDDYDLIDDELHHYLSRIPARRLVLISDSCNSGSIGRDTAKTLPPDTRPHPLGRRFSPADTPRGAQLSATSEDLFAFEEQVALPAGGFRTYGVFTWHLVSALRTLPREATWGEVFTKTTALVEARKQENYAINQRPQLEGDRDLQAFGTGRADPRAGRPVAVLGKEDDAWILQTGQASGTIGGCLFKNSGDTSTLEVTEAGLFLSKARLVKGKVPEVGALYRLAHFRLRQGKLRLAVAARAPDEAAGPALLARILETFPDDFAPAPDADQADWVMHLVRDDAPASRAFFLPPENPEGTPAVMLTDAAGRMLVKGALWPTHTPDTTQLADLKIYLKREALLRLADGRDTEDFVFTPIFLRQGEPTVPDGVHIHAGGAVFGEWHRTSRDLPTGTVLAFRLKNLSSEERYLYVLNFGPKGAVRPAFPNAHFNEAAARFAPGEERYLERAACLFNDTGWEQIRIISTAQPLDVAALTVDAPARNDTHPVNRFMAGDHGYFDADAQAWSTRLITYKVTDQHAAP